jgi:hypothetical protein
MFIIDLWLMLLKKIIDSSYGWWGHQPLKNISATIKDEKRFIAEPSSDRSGTAA